MRWHNQSMVIRNVRIGDEVGVAEVRVRGWQVGYAGIVDASFLDAMSMIENAERWASIIEKQGGLRRVFVAVDELTTRIVGYSTFGPYRLETGDDKTMETTVLAEPGTVAELYGFYVHPDHWGSGVSSELMAVTLDALTDDGWQSARLWMLEANGRARRFYARHGWFPDGTKQPLAIPGDPIEIRLARALPTS